MHGEEDEVSDVESIEDAVFDIDAASDDDSEDEEFAADERYAALARQAKTLEAKLRIARGEKDEGESGSDDEEEEGKHGEGRWGNKRAYYDADNIDLEGSEEEDALQEEEEEARRLQSAVLSGLDPEDYGVAEGGDSPSSSEDGSEGEGAGDVEFVPRDIAGLTEAERAAAAAQAAPELAGLLAELRGSLAEVRHRVGPLLKEVREGELATAEGLSYLEAKHLLLLQYCIGIVVYLLLKAEGRQVAGHPVIARLVEIKAYLERLLAAAEEEAAEQARVGGTGLYRPPRLNPVSMEMEEGRATERQERHLVHKARRAGRSTLLSEIAREVEGAPEELRETLTGMDSAAAVRQRHRLAAREAVEEDLMLRVPLSREEGKAQRAARRAGLAGAALLDDFREDVASVLEGGLGGDFQRHRTGQRWGGDASAAGAARPRSGDADLPAREPLAKRRAAFDSVAAKKAQRTSGEKSAGGELARTEDEFYASVKASKAEARRVAKEAYKYPDTQVPLEEPQAPGARGITTAIEKNRGFTPHRRRDLKNPRKKNRIKFDEATVRRKGQVQGVKAGAAGSYGGEATGIKSRISKSVKF
ncbi:Something about silencing protein 10 [Auxenochlorella protothecoides]|uniref:Something about silencing protein 10 n=1 Tax=Auxenochlorella protothecoides TaxID=3075 RepID=A0A087SJ50_AUXPR|nr:Something about silencing protein 10 [Auxenochlorella protothecoides]KFM25754.1 Something about silencing protein 10 [Auxenochlorella protothecoides]